VFLIARTAQALARWDSVERRRKNAKANWKGYPIVTFLQETGLYEGSRRIKNGSRDLHRQVDTQGFVFPEKEALSTRAVAPPRRKRLPADAYQNTSQSRIHRINRETRNAVEGHCGRVFLDATGKDTHRSTPRYVPLGKTIPQGRHRGRVSFARGPGAMSETWDVSLCFGSFEPKMIEKGEPS
jgi:hypothetical protein